MKYKAQNSLDRNVVEAYEFTGGEYGLPDFLFAKDLVDVGIDNSYAIVVTDEGNKRINIGDYILIAEDGSVKTCSEATLNNLYLQVKE